MARIPTIGKQDFESVRKGNYFYIDKTDFIREWWESGDDVTLITRPRRFGKTLTLSMLDYFFSLKHAERADLFEGLSIWEKEEYRALQGTCPVIALSFAGIKARTYSDFLEQFRFLIRSLYANYDYLWDSPALEISKREQLRKMGITPFVQKKTNLPYRFSYWLPVCRLILKRKYSFSWMNMIRLCRKLTFMGIGMRLPALSKVCST